MTVTSKNTGNTTQPQESQETQAERDERDRTTREPRHQGPAEVRLVIPTGRDGRSPDSPKDYARSDVDALRDAMHMLHVHSVADLLDDHATDEEWAEHYRVQAATMRIAASLADAYADHLLDEASTPDA